MKNIFVKALLFVSIAVLTSAVLQVNDPKTPVWAQFFQQQFIQQYVKVQKFATTGRYWYDSQRNATRVDRRNGLNDQICGTVLPNVSTPCVQLMRDSKRFVYYPQKTLCCVCCDANHGCGILKRDWLKTSKYEGREELLGQPFDKWSIPDGDQTDYYWATADQKQLLRKLTEGNEVIKDYLMNSYKQQKADEIVFALPRYCDQTKWCPSSSFCGKFR